LRSLAKALPELKRRILANWKTLAWFLVQFTLLSAPLYALIYFRADFGWAQEFVASQVAGIARLLAIPAVSDGYLVRSGSVILEIIDACVAWKDLLAFVALVLATPGRSGWSKLSGILVGLPAIYFANLARLLTILVFARTWPELTQIVHAILWKVGMIGFILLVWVLWLFSTGPPAEKKAK
jgi:exosortase/archaeosortase family protein